MTEIDSRDGLLFECGICMDSKSIGNVNFLPCIHFLCSDCYYKLVKNECPYCRTVIDYQEEDSYDETENEYSDVNFEILIMDEKQTSRRKRKYKKRVMKLVNKNADVFVYGNRNGYTVLSNLLQG